MKNKSKIIKIDTSTFDGISSFERLGDTDYGDSLYGKEVYAITLQDIMHLMHGGSLYSTCQGEYAIELYFAGDEKAITKSKRKTDDEDDEE